MLPPVDPGILSANPKFHALHRDICTNKLNQDGTSLYDKNASKERDTLATDLRAARLEAAKRNLISTELRNIPYRGDTLPEDLQELVAITAAYLDGNVPEDDQDIVQDYVNALIENPSRVAAAVEQNLNHNAATLSRTTLPQSRSDPAQILKKLEEHSKSTAIRKANISAARIDVTNESQEVHELYKQILASSIRLLEQTIHGSVSRASKAKAEYLAAVAEGMAKKLGIQHQQLISQVYSGDLQDELEERSTEMSREERNVKRKIGAAEEKLEQYRAGRGMESMANDYAEILRETARVQDEIARLESQRAT